MSNHHGDGVPTQHFWSRILTPANMAQASSKVGIVVGAIGVGLQQAPNPWAQVAGQVLIALGATGVAHNDSPTTPPQS